MNVSISTLSNPKLRTLRLSTAVGLSAVFLFVLLWMLPGLSPVQADPIWYVDGAGGADDTSCGTTTAPCETISYTLNTLAGSGDIIRVAQGTYLENLTIDVDLTLEGGYEATGWTRDTRMYETIIDGSGNGVVYGDWDGERVRYPMVIQDGSTYKMWYVGLDFYSVGRVGYATSPDGLAWTRHLSNPVLDVGAPGAWDAVQLEAPFVIKESASSYKMWYSGQDADGVWRIGYATSSDGVNWTKDASNPVLDLGSETWNNIGVLHPSVVKQGGTYKMWLLTFGDDGSHVAYATSSNGVDWTWHAASPLFGLTFEQFLWRPNVLSVGSTYHMWYSLWSSGEGRTGYASAPNETAWTKHGAPVLSGSPGEWDEGRAVDPFVIYDAPTYTIWYDNTIEIGVASTDNPTAWTKYASNPVFVPGAASTYGQPVIEVAGGDVTVELDGLTITGGQGEKAGGVYAGGAHVIIRDCLIRDNLANGASDAWGGGGVIGDGPLLTIVDSVIVDNRVAQGAGGVRVGLGSLVLSNTLVADNVGDMGLHVNGSATLLNSTISGNDQAGVLFNPQTEATLLITNSIIYGNERSIDAPGGGTAQVDYSDVEGGWSGAGTGNIDVDPRFADPAKGDYRLGPGSPAIDAGTDAGAPDHDLDGNSRPVDGDRDGTATTDMGAYEFVSAKVFLPVTFKNYKP